MNFRYLLSSVGIHTALVILLSLTLTTPQHKNPRREFAVEFQKASEVQEPIAKKNRLKPIVVTAQRDALNPNKIRKTSSKT